MVGINTWYSTSIDVAVATVITTWIQYNGTLVPGNSTTVTATDATSVYGTYQADTSSVSLSGLGAPTKTETYGTT